MFRLARDGVVIEEAGCNSYKCPILPFCHQESCLHQTWIQDLFLQDQDQDQDLLIQDQAQDCEVLRPRPRL